MSMKLLAVLSLTGIAVAQNADLIRAKQASPRAHFTGSDFVEIRTKLNAALQTGSLAMPKAAKCGEFTLQELAKLEEAFFVVRSPELFTSDLRAPKHKSIESLRDDILKDLAQVEEHPEVFEAIRDGRCAELAMQWVHHLGEDARASFGEHKLPLLAEKGTREHAPGLIHDGHYAVTKKLASQITCQIGHAAVPEKRGIWKGFPSWPFEVTYDAFGYGPYPFWYFGGAVSGAVSGEGTAIHTIWSSVLNAERLEHAACDTKSIFGLKGACVHLFLNNKSAYLFLKDESDCCISSYPGYACELTTVQRDFYKVFPTKEILQDYRSEHGFNISGPVIKYSMHLTNPSNFYFWYVTDMDGTPIEQGEGPCNMYSSSHDRNCRGPPKMLFHQYDTKRFFTNVTLHPENFAVPDVCKTTKKYCVVQPTNFCGPTSATVII